MSEMVGVWWEGRNYGESGDMRPMGLRWYLPSNVTNYEGGNKDGCIAQVHVFALIGVSETEKH
jgi:hypothetical protein